MFGDIKTEKKRFTTMIVLFFEEKDISCEKI